MRFFTGMLVAAVAVSGCSHRDERARPDPAPSATTESSTAPGGPSASPAPKASEARECPAFAIDEPRATGIASALPEIGLRLREHTNSLVVLDRPSCSAAYFVMGISDSSTPSAPPRADLRVDARYGTVRAASMCEGKDFIPYAEWSRENAAITRVSALPEVLEFGRMLDQRSKNTVPMTMHFEHCPSDERPNDDYAVYVGEHHEDHSVRWNTFEIDRKTDALSVIGYDRARSYAEWAKTERSSGSSGAKVPPR